MGQIEEIVVTAQKREQSLLEVPLSVSALGGVTLEKAGVESVDDIELLIPSFYVAENSGSALIATAFVTRGIGVNGNIPYFEPSTALFVDGSFRSRSALGMSDLVNVERIEMLRGPQTTLYGRNASAGVLAIHTARPREQWGGFVDLRLDREDVDEEPFSYLVRGETSGPLSDTIGAGISFTYRDQDDAFTVTGSPIVTSENDDEAYSVRGQLEFQPNRANVRITGGYSDRTANGPAPEIFWDELAVNGLLTLLENTNAVLGLRQAGVDLEAGGAPPGTNAQLDALLAIGVQPLPEGVTVIPPHNDRWDRRIHMNEPYRYELSGGDITIDASVDLPNGLIFNSVTSYNEYDGEQVTLDIDQLPVDIGRFREPQSGEAFSQELRLSSPEGDGRFDWIAGVFYLYDDMNREVSFLLDGDAPLFGVGIDGDTGFFQGGVTTKSLSAFGQGTWRLNDRTELSAGLRFTDETKDGFKRNSSFNGAGPASPVFLNGGFASVFDPADSGSTERDTTGESFSLTLSHQTTEEWLLYGRYSRGFKSGGFNVVWGPVGPGESGFEFDDETVDSFEVGAKGVVLEGRGQIGLSAFYQTHDDYQTAAFLGTIFSLSNAEEARTQGIELETSWLLTDAFSLALNLSWVDAEYETFTQGPCDALDTPGPGGFCDQSGEQLPFVSDFSGNLSFEYAWPLAAGEVSLRGDLAYASDYNPDLVLAPFLEQDAYTHVNLRLAWSNDTFDVAVFAENLTDAEIVDWAGAVNVIPGTTSGQFVVREGRTVGVSGRVRF